MYSIKNTKTAHLGREVENLLKTERVLEVQSTIADIPRIQFLVDDVEVLVPDTLEPKVTPKRSTTILEMPKRVIKKIVSLIEEMEGRNCCVEELTRHALSVTDDV